MKMLAGKKNTAIAVLSAAVVGLSVWLAVEVGGAAEQSGNPSVTNPPPGTAIASPSSNGPTKNPPDVGTSASPSAEEAAGEPTLTPASQRSPDGRYLMEAYGRSENVTAGGAYPAEGIRLTEVGNEQPIWSMTPGYYRQQFIWSPDSRYAAVYFESRIYGGTIVVDAQEQREIALPDLIVLLEAWGDGATASQDRPDFYAEAAGWLGNGQLCVAFRWSGEDDTRFAGLYTFDVATGEIGELIKSPAEYALSDTASRTMSGLVEALNNEDAAALLSLLQAVDPLYYGDQFELKHAEEAIEKIKLELDPGTIAYEIDRSDPIYASQPIYRLTGTRQGMMATIRDPLILSGEAERIVFRWAYFSYLVYADDYTAEYLRLIQAGDAGKLARFLLVDDLVVPDAVAAKLIDMYRLYFGSTDKLKIEYTGPFLYRVYLEKGKEAQESHAVSILYGDGLMGIDDSFMPDI